MFDSANYNQVSEGSFEAEEANYEKMTVAQLYTEAKNYHYFVIQGDDYYLQTRESLLSQYDEDADDDGVNEEFGDVSRESIEASPFWLLQGSNILVGLDGEVDPFDYLGGRYN